MTVDYFEQKKAERTKLWIEAVYELNGIKANCDILDITSKGLKIRVKGLLYKNDRVNIIAGNQNFPSIVVNVEGNIIDIRFMEISDSQLSYIFKLKGF
jgi:hypothetical protein